MVLEQKDQAFIEVLSLLHSFMQQTKRSVVLLAK